MVNSFLMKAGLNMLRLQPKLPMGVMADIFGSMPVANIPTLPKTCIMPVAFRDRKSLSFRQKIWLSYVLAWQKMKFLILINCWRIFWTASANKYLP